MSVRCRRSATTFHMRRGELLMLTTARVENFDRRLKIISTKSAEKRKQHGSKGSTVFPPVDRADASAGRGHTVASTAVAKGISPRMVVPAPGLLSIDIVPPIASRRSAMPWSPVP